MLDCFTKVSIVVFGWLTNWLIIKYYHKLLFAVTQILEYFGFSISDDDFSKLCSHLSFINGHMTYTNFLLSFEDSRPNGRSKELIKQPNHKFNEIRGDKFNFSAEEIESRLRQKLRENFQVPILIEIYETKITSFDNSYKLC